MNTLLISLFIFSAINTGIFSSDSIDMVDEGSGKIFHVSMQRNDSFSSLKAVTGLITMDEYYLLRNDTFYLTGRLFGFGSIKKKFLYNPMRIRMVFPLEEGRSWSYKGKETSFAYNKAIESNGYIEKDSNGFTIYNITKRSGAPDTSILSLDTLYNLTGIKLGIPNIIFVRSAIGIKKNYIFLKKYERNEQKE